MHADDTLDARGLLCPMPIVKLAQKAKAMQPGQVLALLADDKGADADIPAWCQKTGNEYLGLERESDHTRYFIKKAGV